jgi:hypothetical protein
MASNKKSLKLFISVDIINSTSYKHSYLKENYLSSKWVDNFKEFYEDFPISLQKQYKSLDKKKLLKDKKFKYPYIWKYLGDEIVFVVEIKRFKYLSLHIEALKKAISQRNIKDTKVLKIKATAWLAGFPVVNQILGNYKVNKKDEVVKKTNFDFIGPSIDLGFRISKYSSERKLVISLDLAYLLAKLTLKEKSYHFYFDKHKETKGIHDGKYPIIWIDNKNAQVPLEDELYGLVRKSSNYEQLIQYCYDYMMDKSKYKLMPPFIDNDKSFDLKPKNYDENYALICEEKEENKENKEMSKKVKNIPLENLLDYMKKNIQ